MLELIGDYRNEIIVCYLIAGIGSVCYASSVREINLFLASKKIEGVAGPDEPVAFKQIAHQSIDLKHTSFLISSYFLSSFSQSSPDLMGVIDFPVSLDLAGVISCFCFILGRLLSER